jgi:hypothetical protein
VNVRARWLGTAAVTLVLAGALAGCSSDSSNGTAGSAVEPAGPAAADQGGTSQGTAGSAKGPAAAGPSQDSATATGDTSSIRIEPALIRTAGMTVVVRDVAGRAAEAESAVRAAGGAVAGDDRSGAGSDAHATLVLKVPPGRMDALLDQLGDLGTEQSRTSSTQDVTEDVADIGSRVATMQASIARVRAILSRAEKIGDVVAVEGELSRRTTELESLQARQRALAGQVDLATITLQLRATPAAATAPAPDRSGFAGGLQDGWRAFAATVGALLTGLGVLLPFLVIAVPVAFALRWALRRRVTPAASAPAPLSE